MTVADLLRSQLETVLLQLAGDQVRHVLLGLLLLQTLTIVHDIRLVDDKEKTALQALDESWVDALQLLQHVCLLLLLHT